MKRDTLLIFYSFGTSAGDGYSTIDDLLKFARAIESGELRIPDVQSTASARRPTDQPAGGRRLNIGGGAQV